MAQLNHLAERPELWDLLLSAIFIYLIMQQRILQPNGRKNQGFTPGVLDRKERSKLFFLLFTILLVNFLSAQDLHIMTFNIRYHTAADSLNAWPYRKDKVAAQVLFHDVHLLGVQEALHGQLVDLKERLPQFRYIGVGRDDGKEKGEYAAIFYDTTRLQALQWSTFWLSQTPGVPGSKGWDAAITRLVTWARMKDRKKGKIFYAFNTHFDHIGEEARRESARLLLQKVAAIAGKMPALITGDFNATPADEPVQVITDAANPLRLTDSKAVSATPHYGPLGTFTGFGPKEKTNQPIDYIFLKGSWKVKKHATLSQSWDGRFASDHFAVMVAVQ